MVVSTTVPSTRNLRPLVTFACRARTTTRSCEGMQVVQEGIELTEHRVSVLREFRHSGEDIFRGIRVEEYGSTAGHRTEERSHISILSPA